MASTNGEDSSPAKELWRPSSPEKTKIYEFKELVSKKHNIPLKDYNDLWQWSVTEPAKFWEEIWHYTAIKAHQPYTKVSCSTAQDLLLLLLLMIGVIFCSHIFYLILIFAVTNDG